MREAAMTAQQACAASEANPLVAPPLKVSDCSQVTDGAAAVVVCSRAFAEKLGRRESVRLLGFGHATDHLPLDKKDAPQFTIASQAAARAYAMAKLSPQDLHGVEVHDCFSISEIVAYEILGLAERGQGPKLVDSGATALPVVREQVTDAKPTRSIPVNSGGGLIGDGHPVGATGVRQVVEIFQHLTGRAGSRQIAGATRMLAFNMGGSFTTAVATIWGR
jgi:acetyl-CoA C-acetyltransferase